MIKYFLLWFPMLILAIINGIIREEFVKKYTDNLTAHQLSTLTLLILFSFYFYFIIKHFTPVSTYQSIFIGLLWLILTLIFEFGFGYYRGNSFSSMLEDYNVIKGRLWILIPIWVAIGPYFFYKTLR